MICSVNTEKAVPEIVAVLHNSLSGHKRTLRSTNRFCDTSEGSVSELRNQ